MTPAQAAALIREQKETNRLLAAIWDQNSDLLLFLREQANEARQVQIVEPGRFR